MWAVAGLAAALVLAPTAAVAAGVTYTHLEGANGTKVVVTPAGQVQATSIAPASLREWTLPIVSGLHCSVLVTAPKNAAVVIKDVALDVYAVGSTGAAQNVALFTGSDCSFPGLIDDYNPPTVGTTVLPFASGLVVPAGQSISIETGSTISTEAYAYGEIVPAKGAGAFGQPVSHSSAPSQR